MNINRKNKKLLIVVQARYDSQRFKGKVLKNVNNKSILEIIINRIKKSRFCENLVVATTKKKNDVKVVNLCKEINVEFLECSAITSGVKDLRFYINRGKNN